MRCGKVRGRLGIWKCGFEVLPKLAQPSLGGRHLANSAQRWLPGTGARPGGLHGPSSDSPGLFLYLPSLQPPPSSSSVSPGVSLRQSP